MEESHSSCLPKAILAVSAASDACYSSLLWQHKLHHTLHTGVSHSQVYLLSFCVKDKQKMILVGATMQQSCFAKAPQDSFIMHDLVKTPNCLTDMTEYYAHIFVSLLSVSISNFWLVHCLYTVGLSKSAHVNVFACPVVYRHLAAEFWPTVCIEKR